MITQFRGPYRFLSSFAEIPCTVPWFGDWTAPTREHAYQACKAASWEEARFVLAAPGPGEAKRRGREIRAWPDWDARRRSVMLTLALGQFTRPGPGELLAATAGHPLVEGNTWGDDYWGAVPAGTRRTGRTMPLWKPDGADPGTWLAGDNWLGRVLMMARDVIS